MRTQTANDTALLTSPGQSFRTWIKVELTRVSAVTWGSETWVDLTDLNDHDWVKGVEYGESIDSAPWTATVKLHSHLTDNPLFSLSPFLANSPNNIGGILVQPYRKIRISTATVPMDTPRANATFRVVFVGRIDSYTMGRGEITLQCRDRTAELMEVVAEYEQKYGDDTASDSAQKAEEVIQNLIDDHYNTQTNIASGGGSASSPRASALSARDAGGGGSVGVPFHLYSANGTSTDPWVVGDATTWQMRLFENTKSPVWGWCKQIADQIGYQLRMRFHEGTGIDDFVLVFELPDRAKSTADLTLDPTLGQCVIESVGLSSMDVRNRWRVGYALNGGEATATSVATDASSITKYGPKFAEINEGSSSQIDTSTEADTMRDTLLDDTQEPTAQVSLSTPYLPIIQLNDLIQVNADNFFFDTNQKLAVKSRRNIIQQGGVAHTKLMLEGLPKSGVRSHLTKQRGFGSGRPGPQITATSIGFGGMLPNSSLSTKVHE